MNEAKYYIRAGIILYLFLFLSCSKWDNYKKYTKDGETIYTGKVDSIQIYPGFHRIRFIGRLTADPTVKDIQISWSDGLNTDSVVIGLSGKVKNLIIDTVLNINMEGTLNFKIQTFDGQGDKSLVENVPGQVYGDDFPGGLTNRPIVSAIFGVINNRLRINWGQMDRTLHPLRTIIRYVNLEGDTVSTTTSINGDATVINDVNVGRGLQYFTEFLPDSAAIDTLDGPLRSVSPFAAFSDSVATVAFNSFYNNLYDPDRNLFYLNTNRGNVASGWTQAIFFDMMLDNYARTKKESDLGRINKMYQGMYSRYSSFVWSDIKKKNGWIYDDMLWMVVALIKGYQITGQTAYLDTAESGLDFVWADAYDPSVGAILWSWKPGLRPSFMATSNYPFIIAAMMLYNITGNSRYLDKAKKIYAWTKDNLFQEATGRVADHVVGNDPPGFEDYTYNQGTCIGANILLYKATGEESYLDDAIKAANYARDKMSNINGILVPENSGEQGVFKTIFAQYIYELIYDMGQTQYLPWIESNIASAWFNRDPANLMYLNYTVPAPTGVIKSYEASSGVAFMQLFNTRIEP